MFSDYAKKEENIFRQVKKNHCFTFQADMTTALINSSGLDVMLSLLLIGTPS